ncbi:MAG: lysoplasmalogenase [Bacteroidaceae bacterium]|nr:lysoplasmalogenase [Bacteroidaceae bacterium]
MDKKRIQLYATIVAFLLAALWFFFPLGGPSEGHLLFAMRLALPAILLTAGSIGLLPCQMTFGFLFCAIGDAMGVIGSFEGQMGSFAIAHICFILFFLKDIRGGKIQPSAYLFTTLLCSLPLILAMVKVLPAIQDLLIRIGCAIYALLLSGTMWTSIIRTQSIQAGKVISVVAALGGSFFLISDFILAWNKFTVHIPNASFLIMSTYYAALLFLFVGTLRVSQIPQKD